MTTITWKYANGETLTADVDNGTNLMEAAVANNVKDIEGECGGCLSCATCHVYVDPEWSAKTGTPDETEEVMLGIAEAEQKPESRLSCQIIVSDELEGLVIHVPEA